MPLFSKGRGLASLLILFQCPVGSRALSVPIHTSCSTLNQANCLQWSSENEPCAIPGGWYLWELGRLSKSRRDEVENGEGYQTKTLLGNRNFESQYHRYPRTAGQCSQTSSYFFPLPERRKKLSAFYWRTASVSQSLIMWFFFSEKKLLYVTSL